MSVSASFELERCRRDPHYYVFEVLRTKDEHNKDNPVDHFPDELCLRATLDDYLVSGKIIKPEQAKYSLEAGTPLSFLQHIYDTGIYFTEKSRHVLVTWITCSYLDWRARSLAHQLILVQSMKEEHAAALVYDKEPHTARISFFEWSLPEHLQVLKFPQAGRYCHLYFPNGSHIQGIPQGGDIIRSHNP